MKFDPSDLMVLRFYAKHINTQTSISAKKSLIYAVPSLTVIHNYIIHRHKEQKLQQFSAEKNSYPNFLTGMC